MTRFYYWLGVLCGVVCLWLGAYYLIKYQSDPYGRVKTMKMRMGRLGGKGMRYSRGGGGRR